MSIIEAEAKVSKVFDIAYEMISALAHSYSQMEVWLNEVNR